MAEKTPISTLHELAVAKGEPLPRFQEGPNGHLFKCTVFAFGLQGEGFGTSKKAAKQESARAALQKLPQSIIVNSLSTPKPQLPQSIIPKISPVGNSLRNYVGELNEFSSKCGIYSPVYNFSTYASSGEFVCICDFVGNKTTGTGFKKMDAKQESAKQMLELVVETSPVSEQYKKPSEKTELVVEDRKQIISAFNHLSLDKPPVTTFKDISIAAAPTITILPEETLDGLKTKLDELDIKYSVQKLHPNPYVVHVRAKFDDAELDFLGCDSDNFDGAVRKTFLDILAVKKLGCSANEIDFS